MSVAQYFQHYHDRGFNFSKGVLTKYCLSLYTKPFLILSGISGTGKTKIAQLFESFVDQPAAVPQLQLVGEDRFISMKVTNGVLNEDGRGNFKYNDLRALFEEAQMPMIEQHVEQLRALGTEDNIIAPETFKIETPEGDLSVGIYLQRASSPLVRVRFISKRGETPAYDSQKYLQEHYEIGDVLKFEKIAPQRLRLVSVNDEAVIAADEQLAQQETAAIDNKLFVSVKSNWTDHTELLGYYNVLEQKYNLTPVLKFMLTAREHPDKPFFLILDEMNLSKVEHYFSDFLSCIESRRVEGTIIKQEKVRLHNHVSFAPSDDPYFDLIPDSVEIPANLYVTGTVNIDETTYAFSPKVLDRANVIEFNEVSLDAYAGATDNSRFVLTQFPVFGKASVATSDAFDNAPAAFRDTVRELLNMLQPYNLHFGYRVINEMALFVNNAVTYVGNSAQVISDAIDVQIAQKVLPKFNGSFGKLDEPLRKLIAYMAGDAAITADNINPESIGDIDPKNTRFPESLTKMIRMYKNLLFNGFASFLD